VTAAVSTGTWAPLANRVYRALWLVEHLLRD
jgi:hypothetical protein